MHSRYGLASYTLAVNAVQMRNEFKIPIVGLDIAGPENGYPAEDHKAAFQFAGEHFLNKTIHAGEGFGPQSINEAITKGDDVCVFLLVVELVNSYCFVGNFIRMIKCRSTYVDVCMYKGLAERIGHGFHIYSSNRIHGSKSEAEKQRYTENLVNFVGAQRITLEVCLTSNLQTMPELQHVSHHPCGPIFRVIRYFA
jgi:adenosine deaminase